jgi:adenylosuccinate synthase
MLVNPIFMRAEEAHLQEVGVTDAYSRMTVDREALVTTPLHVSMNRLREIARGGSRHGSCGMGIGETMSDSLEFMDSVIRVKDLDDEKTLRRKLAWLWEIKWDDANKLLRGCLEHDSSWRPNAAFAFEWGILSDMNITDKIARLFLDWKSKVTLVDRSYLPGFLHDQERVAVFEGAQGVLLDEWKGFHPYTTWSTTTFKNADELLKGTDCEVTKIGILRAYQTRHGAGPLPTEDPEMGRELPEAHNSSVHDYQQGFRVGAFDTMLLRYAMHAIGHVDELAVTHLDRVPGEVRACIKYQRGVDQMTALPLIDPPSLVGQEELGRIIGCMDPVYETFSNHEAFLRHIETTAQRPVRICSYGPKATDKTIRQRRWT